MNLADWLQGDHQPTERLKAVESLCRAVAEHSGAGTLMLDPARIPVTAGGLCEPEEGRGAPTGRYRAPESVDGQPAGGQAAVYTVGVLCFEILSGRDFEARGGPLLRDVRPDLPRDFSDAVQACLEMDAEWRPKDLSYVLGQAQGLLASSPAASKTSSRSARAPSSPSASAPRTARRAGPAPKSGPLLVFALVVLAASIAAAVYRLRQPAESTPIPPAPVTVASHAPATTVAEPSSAAPAARPSAAALTPAEEARRRASAAPAIAPVAAPVAAPVTTPSLRPAAPSAAPTPVREVAAPTTPAPVAPVAPPTPAATPPPAAAAPVEPTGPAAVTSVSPPILRRGATVLVDVHGVGIRTEHQVRTMHGKEAARGIEVVRQRYVNATLIQVLLKVDAAAQAGAYTLFLVDAAGQSTNTRPFELAK
jgi:hypothetical protein